MKFRILLIAVPLSLIIPAAINTLKAQSDTVYPQNKVLMNNYTYTPVLYERGTSTADMRLYPNPARGTTNVYINSIRQEDNGEVAIFNLNGETVYRNYLRNGNNSIDLGNVPNGWYVLKIFMRNRFVYTTKLMVQK